MEIEKINSAVRINLTFDLSIIISYKTVEKPELKDDVLGVFNQIKCLTSQSHPAESVCAGWYKPLLNF